jgi:peptidoglycan/LPS O-acetylase OafA/YrhL
MTPPEQIAEAPSKKAKSPLSFMSEALKGMIASVGLVGGAMILLRLLGGPNQSTWIESHATGVPEVVVFLKNLGIAVGLAAIAGALVGMGGQLLRQWLLSQAGKWAIIAAVLGAIIGAYAGAGARDEAMLSRIKDENVSPLSAMAQLLARDMLLGAVPCCLLGFVAGTVNERRRQAAKLRLKQKQILEPTPQVERDQAPIEAEPRTGTAPPKPSGPVHLPGLNGLRFLAALVVLLPHVEHNKDYFHYPFHYWSPMPSLIGVILFFALSGFLITYLLMVEKTTFGSVALGQFYARRILRIWPLYFLIVFASLFVLNEIPVLMVPGLSEFVADDRWNKLLLCLVLLPTQVRPNVPYGSQVWSIGIEEQFYLVWPLAVKYCQDWRKLVGFALIGVFLFEIGQFAASLVPVWGYPLVLIANLGQYHCCIAIGCLTALLYVWRSPALRLIYSWPVQVLTLAVLAWLFWHYGTKTEFDVDHRIFAVLFSILIVNVATNPRSILKLENRPFDFLGRISYGIYMYHPICVTLALLITRELFSDGFDGWLSNLVLYALSLTITIGVAAFSYRYFEGWFLRWKDHFARVISSPAASGTPSR